MGAVVEVHMLWSTSSVAGQGLSCSVTCGFLTPGPHGSPSFYFKLQPSSQDFLSPLLAVELVTNRLLFCLLSFPIKM